VWPLTWCAIWDSVTCHATPTCLNPLHQSDLTPRLPIHLNQMDHPIPVKRKRPYPVTTPARMY
jgi:hypothetical protein